MNTDQFLTHYWPFENGTMLDVIGSAHMTQGQNTIFTNDRFLNANSALALNGGWTQVPSGVYFNTPEFTISLWVYPQNVGFCSRVLDFSNSQSIFADNVYFKLDNRCTGNVSLNNQFEANIFSGSVSKVSCLSSSLLANNQWQYIVVTYDQSVMSLYLNGILTGTCINTWKLLTLTRAYNYIGRAFTLNSNVQVSYSYLDDLRFYNKSLTQMEIVELYQNQTMGL